MLSLKNKTKRTQVVNLPHAVICEEKCYCTQSEHRGIDLDPNTGEYGVKLTDRLICSSVHLLPGIWSDALPDAVANVPEIAALLARKGIESKAADAPSE